MKKVIFFDIDGTLIDSHNGKKDISSRVKQSLRDLQRRGQAGVFYSKFHYFWRRIPFQ